MPRKRILPRATLLLPLLCLLFSCDAPFRSICGDCSVAVYEREREAHLAVLHANSYDGPIKIIPEEVRDYTGVGDAIAFGDWSLPDADDDGLPDTDDDGLPVQFWRGDSYYNPVGLAGYALHAINQYQINSFNKDKWLDFARRSAEKLEEISVVFDTSTFFPYYFYFWLTDQFTPPWYSGMAQGRVVHLYSRLYDVTGHQRYLDQCSSIIMSFFWLRSSHEPWVSLIDENGYFWIEEYPTDTDSPVFVLNGFAFALMGIYEYYIQSGNRAAEILLRSGIRTIRDNVVLYRRPGQVSRYCLRPDANGEDILAWNYHAIHVRQLRWLHQVTGDPFFEQCADLFEADYDGTPEGNDE